MKIQITPDKKIVNWGDEPWHNQTEYPDAEIVQINQQIIIDYKKNNYWIDGKLVVQDKELTPVEPSIEDRLKATEDAIKAIRQAVPAEIEAKVTMSLQELPMATKIETS